MKWQTQAYTLKKANRTYFHLWAIYNHSNDIINKNFIATDLQHVKLLFINFDIESKNFY